MDSLWTLKTLAQALLTTLLTLAESAWRRVFVSNGTEPLWSLCFVRGLIDGLSIFSIDLYSTEDKATL